MVANAKRDERLRTSFLYNKFLRRPSLQTIADRGIFSSNNPSSGTEVNEVDDLGTVNFCAGASTQMLLSP